MAANRPANVAVGGASYLAAATTRSASLRPGGRAAGNSPTGDTHVHANSQCVAGGGAAPAGGRAGAEGIQQHEGSASGGATRARTVSMADARRGAAEGDGFIRVQAPSRSGDAQAGAACGDGGHQCTAAPGDSEGDQCMDQEQWADWDEGGDDQGFEACAPTEDELKGFWEAAKEVLAYAKRQGYPPEHPVRRNAQSHVDETLAEWQAARPPRAIPTRMGWAEEALQRARKAQARAEQELDDLDRQYEVDREEKQRVLREARERTKERERKLAELSKEAAEEYRTDGGDNEVQMLRGTFRTLDAEVGPALEAALGKADQGSEQHAVLQKALDAVLVLHGALGAATGGEAADYFDLSAQDGGTPAPQKGPLGSGADDDGMDTSAARPPRWMEQQEIKRGGSEACSSGFGNPPPRWKKKRTTEDDCVARAAAGSTADPAVAGGRNTAPAGIQGQEDDFAARRAQIIEQAAHEGADAPTEYLRQLAPEALEEWAKENLV